MINESLKAIAGDTLFKCEQTRFVGLFFCLVLKK
jgi:hypothetical protein